MRATHPVAREGPERAILVGLVTPGTRRERVLEYLEELSLLAESAGAVVEYRIVQERSRADAATFVGSGKAEEVGWLAAEKQIDLVIFDDDLSPVQVRNLEKAIRCKVLDRSGLILDLFASRARTSEAKTQVELAQLQYMLPRLTRQWTHLSKQYGGIGTKGPGETQIETDRRAIRTKISHLKERLRRIARERATQRKGRERFPRVALVGYTNAGKSTLLNLFSGAHVPVEDRLFATLDATVRAVAFPPAHTVLLSDTVGFIRKLPHHLVASFRSTLDEVLEADLLLHVVDMSHALFDEQIAVVNETLESLGAGGKPVILVFNKVDRVADRGLVPVLLSRYPGAVCVSASRGINVAALAGRVTEFLEGESVEETAVFSQREYELVSRLHEAAEVLEQTYDHDQIRVRFRTTRAGADRLKRLLARRKTP